MGGNVLLNVSSWPPALAQEQQAGAVKSVHQKWSVG